MVKIVSGAIDLLVKAAELAAITIIANKIVRYYNNTKKERA